MGEIFAALAAPGWRPAGEDLTRLPHPPPPAEALALRGLRAVAGMAVPFVELEKLDALARMAPHGAAGLHVGPEFLAALGWEPGRAEALLRALGFQRTRKALASEPAGLGHWRRRFEGGARHERPPEEAPAATLPSDPIDPAAPQEPAAEKPRRRRRRRRAAAQAAEA